MKLKIYISKDFATIAIGYYYQCSKHNKIKNINDFRDQIKCYLEMFGESFIDEHEEQISNINFLLAENTILKYYK